MAEATTQITVTPKQLGKHLRSIRRKKGLSLSEVARGAGLSRRELVAYERGKLPIPESDLWVLAGSCGVDVAELMPSTSSLELSAAAETTSVSDTVSQLRRTQEDAGITPYLPTLQKLQALPPGKRIPVKERELEQIATALGSTPPSIEQKLQDVLNVSPDEAERLRAMILVPPGTKGKPRALAAAPSALAAPAAPAPPAPSEPVEVPPATSAPAPTPDPVAAPAAPEPVQTFPAAPAAFLDQPLDAPIDPVHGHNVDVFEELARLPEPVPLDDPSTPLPDLLAPPDPFTSPIASELVGPPDGTVELVDSSMSASSATVAWNAADAPPIDVAMRQGSSTWDLGEPPLVAKSSPSTDPATSVTEGWQPPAPEGATAAPAGFWEGTDDWTPDGTDPADAEAAAPETPLAEPTATGEDTWAGTSWDPTPWSPPDAAAADSSIDVSPGVIDEWPREPAERGAWEHTPDPAAVDTGFYVDWGTPDTETPPVFDPFAGSAAPIADEVDNGPEWVPTPPPVHDSTAETTETTWDTWPPDTVDRAVVDEPDHVLFDEIAAPDEAARFEPVATEAEPIEPAATEPSTDAATDIDASATHISWHAERGTDEGLDDQVASSEITTATEWAAEWSADDAPEADEFVTAGTDWQLGNALPLVEVRGQGGLVMRRADERWALADVTTGPDFVAEVEVDFRSGPGLGVLFRASVDEEGRMSGYSFDIDPIYDGGGYLVRQWQADRELWNPIARVDGDDPSSMYGTLLVRIEVVGDRLRAEVNGVEVLSVENLKQASADRGRDAATGDRVGVQAWSSSDLVIDSLRVASR
jgi:transcriptional regulator with XRE-family HTH domain